MTSQCLLDFYPIPDLYAKIPDFYADIFLLSSIVAVTYVIVPVYCLYSVANNNASAMHGLGGVGKFQVGGYFFARVCAKLRLDPEYESGYWSFMVTREVSYVDHKGVRPCNHNFYMAVDPTK